MKKAILAVSFGTTYPDALEKTIASTEEALASAFPEWEVRRAFTSGKVIQILRERDGQEIPGIPQAMEQLEREGFTHVAVQPTFVTHGGEYEKMRSQLEPYRLRMHVATGTPLLHDRVDCEKAADALLDWLPRREDDEALILMGHGTRNSGNPAYTQMERILQARCGQIYMATVKGSPTLDSVKRQLSKRPEIRKVMLSPFMISAGEHACREMSGKEDSWEAELKAAGYSVRCVLKGLGECQRFRELFVEHCRRAIETLESPRQE